MSEDYHNPNYVDRRVNSDKSFAERYGGLSIAVLTIVGSLIAVYTSYVTKMEIIEFKQEYTEKQLLSNEKAISAINDKLEELSYQIEDIDNSNSRSISTLFNEVNKLKEEK